MTFRWRIVGATGLMFASLLAAQESETQPKTYWEDLTDGSIDLYENDENTWVQRVRLSGRVHVQFAQSEGTDARDRDFDHDFDEYRRARIETEIDLWNFASLEIGVDLVTDNRFRGTGGRSVFGYQNLSNARLDINIENALKLTWVDDLDLSIGRQKVGIGYERDQSSNDILTIERSALSDRLGGETRRPTGALIEVGKSDFGLSLGYFSTSPSDEFASFEGDGYYYTRLQYDPAKNWTLFADWVRTEAQGPGAGLTGYAWITSLNLEHKRDRFGFALTVAQGDNGDARYGNDRDRRQGEFVGGMVMPWFWIKRDYLQVVLQGQWQESKESEGIRLANRYLRQVDDLPGFNVENGYGDAHRSSYLGINYHPWGGDTHFMFGVSEDRLNTVRGPVEAVTQWAAFRAIF